MPRSNDKKRVRRTQGFDRWENSEEVAENVKRIESAMSRYEEVPPVRHTDSIRITPQNLMFVHYYLSGLTPGAAAVKAGYDRKSGTRMLGYPYIQEEIEKRRAALAQLQIMDKAGLMAELLVMFNDLGNDKQDVLLKMKIIEMLAKMQNFFGADTQVNMGTHTNHIKIEIVRPEEHGLPGVIEIQPEKNENE